MDDGRRAQENYPIDLGGGYKIRPFPGGHTELLAPDGKQIGVYNFSWPGLPTAVMFQIIDDDIGKHLRRHNEKG